MGAIAFGMMLGWSSVTQDDYVDDENFYFPVSPFEFSWIVAMMPLGAAVSVFFSGLMREKLGTRLTIFLFVIPITIGYALITLPFNVAMVCDKKIPFLVFHQNVPKICPFFIFSCLLVDFSSELQPAAMCLCQFFIPEKLQALKFVEPYWQFFSSWSILEFSSFSYLDTLQVFLL